MAISRSLKRSVLELPEPASPAAYFHGLRRVHACPLDDILVFARHSARSLRRRSAESHLHRRFVLAVCLKTAATLSVDGIPFAIKPGEAHLVFPHSYHHFLDVEKSSVQWLLVTFETKEPEKLVRLRHRTILLDEADGCSFEKMVEAFRDGDGDRLHVHLSAWLCRWCEEPVLESVAKPLPTPLKDAGLWQRFQDGLENVPPEELRIGPLARRLSISERHLREKFQQQHGVSLGTYLKNYRIRRAIGLLASSDLSQAEVADQCGYRSSSSFHRAFVAQTGMSPSEFRS